MTRDEEIEGLTLALDRLLTALEVEAEKSSGDKSPPRSASEILSDIATPRTPTEIAARRIIADPIGRALRMALYAVGERLHELGGLVLMGEALAAAAALKPEVESWRESVLDHAWSGIGDWMA